MIRCNRAMRAIGKDDDMLVPMTLRIVTVKNWIMNMRDRISVPDTHYTLEVNSSVLYCR